MSSDPPEEQRRLRWVRRGAWAVLLLGILAFLIKGANNPDDPVLVPAGDQAGARSGEATSAGPSELLPDLGEADGDSPGAPPAGSSEPASPPTTSPALRPAPTSPSAPAPGPDGATSGPGSATTAAPAPPAPRPGPAPARRPLAGFDDVAFRILGPDGGAFDGVAMLADDGATRSQGLMEQTDLRGYDGMIFRFQSATTGRFFMRNTRIPLSIAFFDAEGRFISSADMEPCPDEVQRCPTYGADRPYVHAIEVPQGGLGRLGIGPGSVLSF